MTKQVYFYRFLLCFLSVGVVGSCSTVDQGGTTSQDTIDSDSAADADSNPDGNSNSDENGNASDNGSGTANLFMLVEPLHGWRQVDVTTRRTKLDFAKQMKELVDVHYPDATKITLVMDNLNTDRLLCLYEAFAPTEARRLIEKIEVVHRPKHGSWLNMAECELSVLDKQCLGERVADEATLRARIQLWNSDRNRRSKKIDWQFPTADARIKRRRLYPQTHME